MQTIKRKIEELKLPERNVRIHTEKQIAEFIRSLRMFGQFRPAIIDETDTILVGCGMYVAMKQDGWTEIDVIQKTDLTENEKKKLMIVDNKIFDLGMDDFDGLNAFLAELQTDLDIPGFDESVLQSIVADAEKVTEEIMDYGTLAPETVEKIKATEERRNQEEVVEAISDPTEVVEKMATTTLAEESAETEVKRFVICPHCGEKVWL